MYDMDGDFGRVRLITPVYPERMRGCVFELGSAGWHLCNDRYHIRREQGGSQWLMLFTVAGEGRLTLDGKSHSLTRHTLVLIPPWTPCAYYTPGGGLWEFYWLHPRGELSERFLRLMDARAAVKTAPPQTLNSLTERVERILREPLRDPVREALRISQVLSGILHLLAGQEAEEETSISRQICEYLSEHLAENVSIGALAERVYLSPEHLIRRFKAETGGTPHAYLMKCRFQRAEQLLAYSKWPIARIAEETGFASPSHFTAQFRRAYGQSPSEFRAENAACAEEGERM